MRKAKNLGNRLMAMLLSSAMIFAPIFESVPVYAAEIGAGMEGIGTLPEETFNENVGQTGTEDANDRKLFSVEDKALFATASDFSSVGGWNESIYAEIAGVKAANVTEVSWTGTMTGNLGTEDLKYLVRDKDNNVRIDIPGLKKGTYALTVKAGGNTYTKSDIEVYDYDRSGFAHFNYTRGVGAYNNDGTLKDNAVVLYVTNANKNDVTLTAGGVTVKGIGNILNSVGKDTGGGKTSNGGTPNTNQGVIQKLAAEGKPLVVRFVGTVSESGLGKKGTYTASDAGKIDGLTDYDSTGNGGSVGDNGHMARIQSGKDITLEGIGYDATIDGWGFHFISEGAYPNLGESFEVRNLIFINTPEDAVGMEGQQESANANSKLTSKVERCWIHNNEFYSPNISGPAESDKSDGDGSVDFKRGQYFTCSYNYFEGCHKTNLVGSADTSLQFNLSYHHNYWYLCKARGPLTRRANVHMYNNIFEMQTDYAQNTRADAYIFSEYNLFYACKSPQAVESGAIKSYHDSISSVIQNKGTLGTVVTDKSTIVPNNCKFAAENIDYDKFDTKPEQSYIPTGNYRLTEDFTELRKLITVQTGVMDKTPRKPEEVKESEYSVVERLGDNVTEVVLSGAQAVNLDPSAEGYTNGKINKKGYAFSVNGEFNIKITYSSSSKLKGVLVNAAGENLLYGSGEAVALPAGKYMIQSEQFQPGDSKALTLATFKETTIESIEITPFDSSKHYHKWEKVDNDPDSKAPSCTADGVAVYKCTVENCDQNGKKTEVVPKLGHKYTQTNSTATCTAVGKATYRCSVCGDTYDVDAEALGHNFVWKTDKAATATETGLKHEECTRCGTKQNENTEIPAGTTVVEPPVNPNPGDNQVTEGGEFELYFTNKRPNGDTDFFTVNAGGGYSDSKGVVTVGENEYTYSLKMASSTVAFSCNDGATLYLAFAPANKGLKVMVNTTEYTIGADGTLKLENLSAGTYTIAKLKTSGEKHLNYVSVTNPEPEITYYNVLFDFNDDDGKEPIVLQIAEGKSYAAMEALVPASFQKNGYILKGLYMDADCTTPVVYPYVVNSNVSLYAVWEKDDKPVVKMYSIVFNPNGGSTVPDVRIAENQIYTITQRSTRDGYAFAGWYDSAEGGNLVEMVDGSKLSGTYTVYAHWNASEKMTISLDASKDFTGLLDADGNITEKKTVGGFTIHALAGGVGTAGNENPKYYMSVKADKNNNQAVGLYTNGVRLTKTDADIAGNEDGLLKSLEFTAEGRGILTVDLALTASAESGKKYDLVLTRKSTEGSLVEAGRVSLATTGKTRATKTFDVEEAGTYYLYAEGAKGVVYFNLKLTEQQYTVLYQVGTGTVPAGQGSVTAREGQEIQLPVCTANPGYTFKGWSMDGGTTMLNGSYTVKEDDATNGLITIAAIYEASEYTVKFDAAGGKLPAGMEASVKAKAGDRLTLGECTPPTSKKFAGWSVGTSDKVVNGAYYVNAVDANKDNVITLKAVYKDGSGSDPGPGGEDPIDPDEVGLHVRLKNANETYTYTGSAIKPAIIVTNNGERLIEGVDYTVKYSNNVKACEWGAEGDAIQEAPKNAPKITVTGKGNLTGSTFTNFRIARKDISDADLADGVKPMKEGSLTVAKNSKATPILVYNGVKLGTKDYKYVDTTQKNKRWGDPTKDDDEIFDGENGNEKGIELEGIGNYKGTRTVTVKAVKNDKLKTFTVTVGRVDLIYNGKSQLLPADAITVQDKKTRDTLTNSDEQTYYEIVYGGDTTSAGTVKFSVVGMGDYTGTVTKTYTIKPLKDDSKFYVDQESLEESYDYNSAGVTLGNDLKVYYGSDTTGTRLQEGADYKVTYSNNKKVGQGKYTITFLGNFKGSKKTGEFEIEAASLKTSEAKVEAADKVFKRAGVYKSAPIVTINGVALKASDYKVEYGVADAEGNVADGTWSQKPRVTAEDTTVKVKVIGKGNYKAGDDDCVYGEYTVCEQGSKKDLSSAKVTFYAMNADGTKGAKVTKLDYTGRAVEPAIVEVTMKGKNEPLKENEDYTVRYVNNKNKGKATVIITAKGDSTEYVGSKTATFSIVAKNLKSTGLLDSLFKIFGL